VNTFAKAFDAGRNAVRNRRTALMLSMFAFMAVWAAIAEYLEHRYVSAVLVPVFILVVMPWFCWNWIKPRD
jgi:hypothetical protein